MVPRTTLRYHFKKPDATTKRGRKIRLHAEDELKIHNWIVECLQLGSPLCSSEVIEGANKLLKKRLGEDCQELGPGWLQTFKKRKHLSSRIPENLAKASANITEQNIRKWFFQVYLGEKTTSKSNELL